jgi:hypothetical protein
MTFREAAYGVNAWLKDLPTTEVVILAGVVLTSATCWRVLTLMASATPIDRWVFGSWCGVLIALVGGGVAHDAIEPDPPPESHPSSGTVGLPPGTPPA